MDARSELVLALARFQEATHDLNEAWEGHAGDVFGATYPGYLPDFAQFASDVASMQIDGAPFILSRRDGSVYTLEGDALVQIPLLADGGFDLDGGCEVDFYHGVPAEDQPRLRTIQGTLRAMVANPGGE